MNHQVPETEIKARLKKLQNFLHGKELDAALLLKSVHLFYYTGSVPNGAVFIPTVGEPVILVKKGMGLVKENSFWKQCHSIKGHFQISQVLKEHGVLPPKRLGMELDSIPASFYLQFTKDFPETTFINISPYLVMLRAVKSGWEVEQIREAGLQLRAGFDSVQNELKEGITELEISAAFENAARRKGHHGLIRVNSFDSHLYYGVVSSGPSSSLSTSFDGPIGGAGLYPGMVGGAGTRQIHNGDTVLVDMVGGYNGYMADQTRVFCIGTPPQTLVKAQRFILDLVMWLESGNIRPGVKPNELYKEIESRVREAGYHENFMNYGENKVGFIGHGIGLELDEPPVITSKWTTPLEAGNVLAIEPKIVFPEGGVGIENTYLITDNGVQNLTPYPKGLSLD